jgi:threonine 3-dehydrogenase
VKALLKSGPHAGLELTEVPEPAAGPADVTVQVLTTGICGTDLHILRWDGWAEGTLRPPMVPGHEFYGEVVAVGSAVRDVRIGDRVSGEGHVVCGICRNCRAGRRQMCIHTSGVGVNRDGAFAERVVIPQENVWVHGHEGDTSLITPELGAVFDPFGNAVHTALKFPVTGEDVLITGAGPIGLMAAAVVRHAGARYVAITDVSEPRLRLAERTGAVDLAVDVTSSTIAEAQRALGLKEGFDVALEMSGHPSALPEVIRNMNHGGRIALLGLPSGSIDIDWAVVVTHMLTLQGIYGREMFETWNAMTAMLSTSPTLRSTIEGVITDVIPAHDWERAFELAASASSGKVLLDWTRL